MDDAACHPVAESTPVVGRRSADATNRRPAIRCPSYSRSYDSRQGLRSLERLLTVEEPSPSITSFLHAGAVADLDLDELVRAIRMP